MSSEYVPHPNAPAPRFATEKSDNSGTVHTDLTYIADRQTIVNHVTAYSYLIDEARWEEWFALFSKDLQFLTTVPTLGTVETNGEKAFRAMIEERYIIPGKNSGAVRRHTMGNVHVVEQTATTAKVRTYMFISSVPAADKLGILTSGTYNANLEKRDGKWTITRWAIECDAPLSPSKLPTGYPESEFKWTPDPYTVIPGAETGPVQGKLTIGNHPAVTPASGPLYQTPPVFEWTDCDFVMIDYLTDVQSAAAFLPEQLTTIPLPIAGYAPVKLIWARYRGGTLGPYNEVVVGIPALYKGVLNIYVPLIYVNEDRAMAAGRELGGWPKKLADIQIDQNGSDFEVSLGRDGQRLISGTVSKSRKLFSTPLPADKTPSLAYPYNLTLPLPPPTGTPQANIPLPTTTIKLFPGVGGNGTGPALAQLIAGMWRVSGDVFGASDVTFAHNFESENDPFHKLPVLSMLGGMVIHGDMSLAGNEIVLLEDLLATAK